MLMMLAPPCTLRQNAAAADAHDAGPTAFFGKRLELLMLMMLAPRGVFRQTVGAADAHDAGSPLHSSAKRRSC